MCFSWPHGVFAAARRRSLVAMSGFSSPWHLLLQTMGSRALRLRRCGTWAPLLWRVGSQTWGQALSLHWQADSQPLGHWGSPVSHSVRVSSCPWGASCASPRASPQQGWGWVLPLCVERKVVPHLQASVGVRALDGADLCPARNQLAQLGPWGFLAASSWGRAEAMAFVCSPVRSPMNKLGAGHPRPSLFGVKQGAGVSS